MRTAVSCCGRDSPGPAWKIAHASPELVLHSPAWRPSPRRSWGAATRAFSCCRGARRRGSGSSDAALHRVTPARPWRRRRSCARARPCAPPPCAPRSRLAAVRCATAPSEVGSAAGPARGPGPVGVSRAAVPQPRLARAVARSRGAGRRRHGAFVLAAGRHRGATRAASCQQHWVYPWATTRG